MHCKIKVFILKNVNVLCLIRMRFNNIKLKFRSEFDRKSFIIKNIHPINLCSMTIIQNKIADNIK